MIEYVRIYILMNFFGWK